MRKFGPIFIISLLCVFGSSFSALAQSSNICRPEVDRTYADSGYSIHMRGYRKFLPSIEYNKFLTSGYPWSRIITPRLGKNLASFYEPPALTFDCTHGQADVVPNVYALAYGEEAPWLIGEACGKHVKIGLMSVATQVLSYSRSPLTETPMDRAMISEIDKQVALARESNQKWIAIPPEQKFGKFEVESLALFRLLASQCGSWPTSVEFVLHLGLEGEMLHTAPAVTKIYARLSNGEYVFEYQNLQSLREFAQDAINVQNEIRSDFAKALREREDRISAWHSREGRFAMGALIVAGILGGAGVLSPCNDNDPDNDPVMLDCFW